MSELDRLPLLKEMSPSVNEEKSKFFGLVATFFILSVGIIAGSAFYYRHYQKDFSARMGGQLSAIAELKVDDLVEWRKARFADASIFYHNSNFTGLVKRFFKNPHDAPSREALQTWLDKIGQNKQYDRAFLLDTTGMERMAIPGKQAPLTPHLAKDVASVFHSGNITFLDFHRDAPDRPIHLEILVPIFDESDSNRPLSVLVLRIDPSVYLYPFIQEWPIPSKTSETLIIRREGNDVLFLNDLKFQRNTALKLRVPLEKTRMPAVRAVLGYEGIMEGIDYRGVPVLAAVRAVPASPWFLVARTDMAEVYAPLYDRLLQMVLFTGLVLAAMGGCLFILLRRREIQRYRERLTAAEALRESEARFSTIFHASPIGMSTTRLSDGQYIDVNEAFLSLFGYTREEALSNTSLQLQTWATPDERDRIVKILRDKGHLRDIEAQYRRKSGEIFAALVSSGMIEVAGERYALSLLQDITERKLAEEALKESEEKFRNIFDNSAIGKSITSIDGSIKVNPAFCQMLGYTMEELARQKWQDISHPDDYELTQNSLDQLQSGEKKTARFIKRYLKKDGSIIWADVNTVLQKNKEGKPLYYITAVVDITDRKRAEEELRAREASYRTLIENIPQKIFMKDRGSRFVSINENFARDLGMRPEDFVGKVDSDFFPKELADKYRADDIRIMETGKTEELEEIYIQEGRETWVNTIKTPVRDVNGVIVGVLGVFWDVTERKRAEEALRRNRTLLDEMGRIARIGAWELDVATMKQEWTDETYVIHDREKKTYDPNSSEELSRFMPGSKELIEKAFGEAIGQGKPYDLEAEMTTVKGNRKWVRAVCDPLADGEKVTKLRGSVQDITNRKRAEEQIASLNRDLARKNTDLEQLIYVTSHDLRTPLVNVQGFAKELARSLIELTEAINNGGVSAETMRIMEPMLKKDVPESLDFIQSGITQMDRQLSALLKLSRLGRAAITAEALDMNRIISEVVKALEYLAQEKGAKIEASELPPCKGDAAQTNQIFLNLVGNALKYLDEKRPGIIQIRGNRQGNDTVYCVEDNGIGIEQQYKNKIFEIFYRVEGSKHVGEGLGLTIVRQSAEKQNGTVWVESEPGKGSRFFVKLPGI